MTSAMTTLRVNFVSELAGYRNTFGSYNKVTGIGGILFADIEAQGRRPTGYFGDHPTPSSRSMRAMWPTSNTS